MIAIKILFCFVFFPVLSNALDISALSQTEEEMSRLMNPRTVNYTIPIEVGASRLTHEMNLTYVVLRDGEWNNGRRPEVTLREVARIYSQCGISIPRATVISADPADMSSEIQAWSLENGTLVSPVATMLARIIPHATQVSYFVDRPVIFFVRSIDGMGNLAFSGVATADLNSSLHNTAWVSNSIWSSRYMRFYQNPTPIIVAHELGHLVLGAGHLPSGVDNIMGNSSDHVKPIFTADQCARARRSPLVRPVAR